VWEKASLLFDDAVDPFGNGVGQSARLDKGDDVVGMAFEGTNKLVQGLEAAAQSGGTPTLREAPGRPWRLIAPEVIELVFEDTRAEDPTVAGAERLEDALVVCGAFGRVFKQQPPYALEGLALGAGGVAPLLLADFIDGIVERLGDVEAIEDDFGVGQWSLIAPM